MARYFDIQVISLIGINQVQGTKMGNLTIKDIARICNVSTSTVSRAMNGDSGINKQTRERILEVIKEHNFVPNNSARNLKMIESNTIALLIKGIDNPFFQSMLHAFETELQKVEYSFIIHAVGEEQDEIGVAQELIKEKKLKGIIFLGGWFSNSEDRFQKLGVPCVICTGAVPTDKERLICPIVSVDDIQGGYQVTDYLCKMGHKRIVIITSKYTDSSVGKLRLEGYKRALKDNGIAFDKNLVRYMDPELREYSMANGYQVTKKLLDDKTDFTAMFAISDVLAFGAYKALKEAGKNIPDDYSIVGYDGLEMTSYYHPALTTLEQPSEDMVAASINQLMALIAGREIDEKIQFTGNLIERDSVKRIK